MEPSNGKGKSRMNDVEHGDKPCGPPAPGTNAPDRKSDNFLSRVVASATGLAQDAMGHSSDTSGTLQQLMQDSGKSMPSGSRIQAPGSGRVENSMASQATPANIHFDIQGFRSQDTQ